MSGIRAFAALMFVGSVACTRDGVVALDATPAPDAAPAADAGVPVDAGSASPDSGVRVDPFAPLPVESEGLTNVSADLRVLLEGGALEGACDVWKADPGDRRKRLLCGKSMFFYETFGTAGVPTAIVQSLIDEFPEIGPGMRGFGMIEDPTRTDKFPLGFSRPSTPTSTATPSSVTFTCASCHFARLPDGRYAVGAPNHDYDYGGQLLAMMVLPNLARPNPDLSTHHPLAIARLQPLIDRLQQDRRVRLRFLLDLLPLLGTLRNGQNPSLTMEQEGQYASWPIGGQDFVIAPLPLDDGVHTVSKISALFAIPRPEEWRARGMSGAFLAWTGGVPTLENFLDGFVTIGDGDHGEWTPERLSPLADYIYSLRAPPLNPALAPDPSAVAAGEAVFLRERCDECHDGPRGQGRRLYTYDEVGTDDAMKAWMDPDLDGQPCCGVRTVDGGPLSHRVKSPRLVGLWAMKRFLHNASVDSLESLFCANGPRLGGLPAPLSDRGHTYGCELAATDRSALLAYLRAH